MPAIRDKVDVFNESGYQMIPVEFPVHETGNLLIASIRTGLTPQGGRPRYMGAATDVLKYIYNANSTTYYNPDSTSFAAATGTSNTTINSGDCVYIGHSTDPFESFVINSTTTRNCTYSSTPTWVAEYWNGSSWSTLTLGYDGIGTWLNPFSSTGRGVGKYHLAYWTIPSDWATTSVNSVTGYWVRWRTTTTGTWTSSTTCPDNGVMTWHVEMDSSDPARAVDGWRYLGGIASGTNSSISTFYHISAGGSEPADGVVKFTSACQTMSTQYHGASILSIRDVDDYVDTGASQTISVTASSGTFTRSSGSFVTDGFVAGMTIDPSGLVNGSNTDPRIISTVSATQIVVTDNTGLSDETGDGDERIVSSMFNASKFNTDFTTSDQYYDAPTLTTDKDDCLILWSAANYHSNVVASGTSLQIHESPAHAIDARINNGYMCSCLAWGYMENAGSVPAPPISSTSALLATYGINSMVVAINPPAAGASVIPAYADDSSVYVNPLQGTAWNGDSAPAGSTSIFGTTLTAESCTSSGSPTVVGSAGVNPIQGAWQSDLNASNSTTWRYMPMVMAAKTNLAGKNILVHFHPISEAGVIFAASVLKSVLPGFAIGLASTSGNFKLFHVGGAGANNFGKHFAPIVVNSNFEAANGLWDEIGTFNDASITGFAIFGACATVSGGFNAAKWLVMEMWGLDTCTILGGSASVPASTNDISTVASYSKYRRSVILQGLRQLLVIQPLQFGNGGTNTLVADFSKSAFEFPQQYTLSGKEVWYNSIDNVVGCTIYLGANDTLDLRGTVFSSPSKFHFGFNASHSLSSTLYTEGMQLIGVGTFTPIAGETFNSVTFKSCDPVDMTGTGMILNNPTFDSCAGDYALSVSSSTQLDNITDGIISNNTVGIKITAAGTYTISGTTFTNNDYSIENSSAGVVTIYVTDGSNLGASDYINTGGGSTTIISGATSITVTAVREDGTPVENARVLLKASDGTGPFPFEESVTITRSGTTATVSHTGHGMDDNDFVVIDGADQPEYDGVKQITYVDANSYSFTVSGSPASPATGTIISTFAALYGLTDVNGEITTSRVYGSNQPVIGWARKSTSSPYLKEGILTGTINSTSGYSNNAVMVSDE